MTFRLVLQSLQVIYDDAFNQKQQTKSRAVASARNKRDAAAVRFDLMFADIHYKFKSSQVPKARLQSSRETRNKSRI